MMQSVPACAADRLAEQYKAALYAYLTGAGEKALARAYDLGRQAAGEGIGILEMVALYHGALRGLPAHALEPAEYALPLAEQFFAESLSPFEMTHRGFREANSALERLNTELLERNQTLLETTQYLQMAKDRADAANRELEAFSYAVSHDLRAPLRAIDGFSAVLAEDYGDKLDDTGRNHLQRVRAAARRMGELIDDLLQLSRVGSAELKREPTNLTELACLVAEELQRDAPARRVELVAQPGLTALADPRLIRVVFENLLGNAWKFTSKTANARVELGAERAGAETVFFIRDNGAGFDPGQAETLFRPFRRLHTTHEFPGTGIGLATVRRIIERHGGRISAEGHVDGGAVFRFTLPATSSLEPRR